MGPTLNRLEEHGLVKHRDRFWTITDAEHAVASAGLHGSTTADEIDGGFSDDEVEAWMETAVDPIESATEQNDESAGGSTTPGWSRVHRSSASTYLVVSSPATKRSRMTLESGSSATRCVRARISDVSHARTTK